MKITTKHLLPVAALAVVFTACKQTDFKKTKEGFPYKVFSSGSGEKVMPGNFVSYHITQKIKDSVLQTSYGNPPMFAGVPKDSAASNPLAALLIEARKGDSIQVIQPVDSMIRKNPRLAEDPVLSKKKGQDLVTYIKVVEVYKNEEEAHAAFEKQNIESFNQQPAIAEQRKKDEAEIEAYLKANNIQAQRTPWGAYIQMLTPGSGPKPKYGDFSMLKYTGKDLNGKVFDTNNKPGGQLMPLQVGAGGTIPGFDDAVRQLPKGSKATIFLPSVIAYGQQGRPPLIQPNQNLVFDIEVVDVTDKRPEPAGAPIQDSTTR